MLNNIPWRCRLTCLITSLCVLVSESVTPPTWMSQWELITTYSKPEVTFDHNLGELPIKVDVEVRITDTSQGKYVVFSAISSGHRGDDDNSEFGGVIYVYDTNQVKVLAPGPCASCSGGSNGKLVHLGGAKYTGPTITGDFSTGHVRVRLWKQCDFAKPTYVSPPIYLGNDLNYQEVVHPLGRAPDHVIVQIHLNGTDWVMDAQGDIMTGATCGAGDAHSSGTPDLAFGFCEGISFYSKQANSFGGVVFATSRDYVRLWTPSKGSGSASNGVVFNAVDGWGNGGAFMCKEAAEAVVWVWDFGTLVHDPRTILTFLSSIPATGLTTLSEPVKDESFLSVKIKVDIGVNEGFTFNAAGTAPTTDSLSGTTFFAGVTYGVRDNNTIMIWSPRETEVKGCLAMVDDMWGSSTEAQCVTRNEAQLVIVLAYTDMDEPPCEDLECNPSAIGPMCVCNGTGFEGQYCGAPIACLPPISHQHAKYLPVIAAHPFNTTVAFTCKDGYEKASGDDVAVCNAYKKWSGSPFICTPKDCGQPSAGLDSTMTVHGTAFTQNVTYVCISGYDIQHGDLVRICLANQTWSGDPPTCDRSCGEPDTNGVTAKRTNSGLTIGVTALYECITGYETDFGNFSRTCMADGNWTGVPPVCKRVTCGAPENATNTYSVLSYTSQEFQSKATYTCDFGYHSNGNLFFQTTCLASRTWSAMDFCEKVACPSVPPGVKADVISEEGKAYADNVVYECHQGTMLALGTLQRTCQANGNWSGSTPVCQDIVCNHPGAVVNGTTDVISAIYGGTVVVICNSGFAIEFGDQIRMCSDGGQWTGQKPHCGEVFQVFLNPVNGTPPYLPFLGIGISPGNNQPLTLEDIQNLLIPWKSTNRYKRTVTTAEDNRWTVKAIGISWLILALSPIMFTVAADVLDYMIKKRTSSTTGSGNASGNTSVAENSSSQKNPPKTKKQNKQKSTKDVADDTQP